jgi:hypothetical protein
MFINTSIFYYKKENLPLHIAICRICQFFFIVFENLKFQIIILTFYQKGM